MYRRQLLLALLTLVALASTTAAAAGSVDLDFPGSTVDQWHGHARRRFQFEGAEAWVVVPETPLPGNPWSWCLMFPDAFTDRCAAPALVARGFHHAFLDVGNTFGSPAAVAKLARFHDELVRRGLSPRPALIGISRGSLYAHRFAADHPDKVSVIYGDAGVCDIRSWPGGVAAGRKGKGSAGDWAEVKKLYGFADDVVPPEENGLVVAERYRALGGTVVVIHKPGIGHHPHGLDDPTPVVEFVIRHASLE